MPTQMPSSERQPQVNHKAVSERSNPTTTSTSIPSPAQPTINTVAKPTPMLTQLISTTSTPMDANKPNGNKNTKHNNKNTNNAAKIFTKTIYYTRHPQSLQNSAGHQGIDSIWASKIDAPLSPTGFNQLTKLKQDIIDFKFDPKNKKQSKWNNLLNQLQLQNSQVSHKRIVFMSSNLRRAFLTTFGIIEGFNTKLKAVAGKQPYSFLNEMIVTNYLRETNPMHTVPSQSVLLKQSEIIDKVIESLDNTTQNINNNGQSASANNIDIMKNDLKLFAGNNHKIKLIPNDTNVNKENDIDQRPQKFVNFIKPLSYDIVVVGGHSRYIVDFLKGKFIKSMDNTCQIMKSTIKHPEDIKNTQTVKFDITWNLNDDDATILLTKCDLDIYLPE